MSGPLLRTSMWSRTAERRIDVAVDRIAVHGWWAHQQSNYTARRLSGKELAKKSRDSDSQTDSQSQLLRKAACS